MQKIKQGDDVIVLVGKDKGKQGKVVKVLENNKVIVDGVNKVKKHQRGNPNLGYLGALLKKTCLLMFQTWLYIIRRPKKLIV